MNSKRIRRLVVIGALCALAGVSQAAISGPSEVPNFSKVTPRLYRGAQPLPGAWPALANLGVKTVIDLRRRQEHSIEAESTAVYAAGMRYLNFPMNGFDTPTNGQIENVLNLLDRDEPIFIHCKLGCDRTGTVIAAYRISREHWTNEKALAEAKRNGLHWYESGMKRFIRAYHRDAGGAGAPGVDTTAAKGPPRRKR
jgi:protein tyrosine/serine phosphatase